MSTLWLLKGGPDASGWIKLEQDAKAQKINVIHFDRDSWALVKAAQAPDGYEGLPPREPMDGLYLDTHGRPCYVAGGKEVPSARRVVNYLGDEAKQLLDKMGDADLVLERLGKAY